jgi:hypothetical protein
MNRFRNFIWIAAGFTILAAAISALMPGSALAQAIKAALIKNIDEPGRSPYYSSGNCASAGGCIITLAAVPANKRLVVQFVSFDVQSGNAVTDNAIALLGDGANNYAWIAPTRIDDLNWAGAQPVTAFISAGAQPKLSIVLNGSTNVQAFGIVTGYLVDLTQ